MVSGTVVDRWLRSAVQDMKENNLTEVLCPCQKCKGIVWLDRYDDGHVEAHLLMTGFMDGYTRWIIEDEDDDCRCQNRRISGRGFRTVRLGGW